MSEFVLSKRHKKTHATPTVPNPQQPMPSRRAIRWTPARETAAQHAVERPSIFITQGALREVMRHLRENPEQQRLGFLLGELHGSPDSPESYVVIDSALRTEHVMAGEESVRIPDEEWVGIELEARRRHAALIGWYHSTPFLGPTPLRQSVSTLRARLPEPWQCGLVLGTIGAPAGGFFRALPDEEDVGAFVPFYELLDDDALLGGRKRTLLEWGNYVTAERVEHAAREWEPYLPPPPPLWPEPGSLAPAAPPPTTPAGDERQQFEPLYLPPPRPPGSRRSLGVLLGIGVVVATAILGTVVSTHRRRTAEAPLTAAPAAPAAAAPATPAEPAMPADTLSPSLPGPAPQLASQPAPPVDPAVRRFDKLADSLAAAIASYRDRRADFSLQRLTCQGLGAGYRSADDAFIALSAVHRDARASLDSTRLARYAAFAAEMDTVDKEFDDSHCPRP